MSKLQIDATKHALDIIPVTSMEDESLQKARKDIEEDYIAGFMAASQMFLEWTTDLDKDDKIMNKFLDYTESDYEKVQTSFMD